MLLESEGNLLPSFHCRSIDFEEKRIYLLHICNRLLQRSHQINVASEGGDSAPVISLQVYRFWGEKNPFITHLQLVNSMVSPNGCGLTKSNTLEWEGEIAPVFSLQVHQFWGKEYYLLHICNRLPQRSHQINVAREGGEFRSRRFTAGPSILRRKEFIYYIFAICYFFDLTKSIMLER